MKLEIQENACGLARGLIADGLNPDEALEFYRGAVLCLRGRAGDFAKLYVAANRYGTPVFRSWRRGGSEPAGGVETLAATPVA